MNVKNIKLDIDGKPIQKDRKCKHCGKRKGDHNARTFNCHFGISRHFTNYRTDKFYEV